MCNGKKGEFEREVVQDSLAMKAIFCELVIILKKKSDVTAEDFQSTNNSMYITKSRSEERIDSEVDPT